MAKRRKRKPREPVATTEYRDAEGNSLVLRNSLTHGTRRKISEARERGAASSDDDWQRRGELLFERLAVSWEIAGLPITEQKLLLGRYRMADAETREWVRRTLAEHTRAHLPELG